MKYLMRQSRRAISLFLLITFSLSALFYFLIIHTGKLGSGFGIYITGLMWCPAIAALITTRIFERKVSGLGWQWGNPKYQLWSYLVPLLYVLAAYSITWATGVGRFYNDDFVSHVSASFGWDQLPKGVVIALYIILTGVFGMAESAARALGEEIGWRGFLVPELYRITNYTATSLITGIVWSLWHFPILLYADYNSGTPAWFALSCFIVSVVSISFVYTWFRLRSNSLWTGVLLHASHNLFIQSIFTPLTKDTGNTKYFIDEFGLVLPLVCICVAVFFWNKRADLIKN
ncbi:CPBP family intramembrane glutamic endopeptidase [Flavihumibacter solisilvae]|uniref:CPBP family intramembrane glutamic endopeptidase n=1 Tax=Flavihumibacter solisilvae TaxID=1349421 RepID=UPI000690C6F4|nr:type II CAAX endopeptidase family protein [Flavihumibacter solisilvae]